MNAATILPSIETLRECFDYNPETGELRWKHRPLGHFISLPAANMWNSRFAGTVAGSSYLQASTKRVAQLHVRLTILSAVFNTSAHRIALALSGIEVQKGMVVDHINGDASDNRLSNLRVCSHAQNILNNMGYRNKDGSPRKLPKGVYVNNGKYNSYIRIGGRVIYVGRFNTPEEAHAAYIKKFAEVHGA